MLVLDTTPPQKKNFLLLSYTNTVNCYQVLQNGTPSQLEWEYNTLFSTVEETNHPTDGVQAGGAEPAVPIPGGQPIGRLVRRALGGAAPNQQRPDLQQPTTSTPTDGPLLGQ